jgi:hypothetical protein
MKQTGLATSQLSFLNRSLRTCAVLASPEAGRQRDEVGRLSVQESPSLEQPPERDAPEERGSQDTRRPIRGSGKGRARALPSTGDSVTWARRMKMRSTPYPAPPERKCLGGTEGAGM